MKITISNNAKIMFSSLSLGEIFMLNETDAERRQRGMTMVKVYIEQEVVSEGIRKYYYKNPPNSSYQEGFDRGLDKAQSVILNAPAADVVKVVRCKDCLYSTERYGHMECIHGVSYRNTWNKPDFFCSYGERKEGAGNE